MIFSEKLDVCKNYVEEWNFWKNEIVWKYGNTYEKLEFWGKLNLKKN